MIALLSLLVAGTLTVGPGKSYARIEEAVAAAKSGDKIAVYPGDYANTAVIIKKPNLTIEGVGKVSISGGNFSYSGVGNVPRAIFQINAEGEKTTIRNFELSGAHNDSFNGAGVRINAANNVTIADCTIHDNDMGVMSNGVEGNPHAGEHQLIERCKIFRNGSLKDPGYNHNLYLGGTSVTLKFCEIYGSLTGHNLKSRAHYTELRYCYLHHSSNRECDFVEGWDTSRSNSNAALLSCVVEKDPGCSGNRDVFHFGRERGRRMGTLFILDSAITTSFLSPIISLTDPDARAVILNSNITNSEQSRPLLASALGDVSTVVTGQGNTLSASRGGFDLRGIHFRPEPARPMTYIDGSGERKAFDPEYRFVKGAWQKIAG